MDGLPIPCRPSSVLAEGAEHQPVILLEIEERVAVAGVEAPARLVGFRSDEVAHRITPFLNRTGGSPEKT